MAGPYYVDGDAGNDSNAGTSPGAGNAWLTIAKLLATMGDGEIGYVKVRAASAVYSIGTGLSVTAGNYHVTTRIIGYTSSITDGGRPTVKATAAIVGLSFGSAPMVSFENFIFDGDSTGTKGIDGGSVYGCSLINCIIKNWTAEAMELGGFSFSAHGCQFTNCGGTSGTISNGTSLVLTGCVINGNSKSGIYSFSGSPLSVSRCIISSNTGKGINHNGPYAGLNVVNCTIYNNTSDGILLSTHASNTGIRNNIISTNGGYGINDDALTQAGVDTKIDYNAFYANTSGARNTTLSASPHDVTLSGDPFTNAAGGDFSLNNTAGAGADCRAAGFPGAMIYGGTGYLDLGALQHQDSGGGGGGGPTFGPGGPLFRGKI